ncbi:uncharacterized protein L201_005616 [Kwoniella dendrophila CBS 6074]|uniref:UBC core domain-containing protein n=1 Tax=Kwoniella dendrophila CBS 6074 TaxID=1295534 RepID=A0AAX4K1M3_9TREE
MSSSSSRPKVNLRSTAVKRIMQEASELANADIDEDGFVAAPLEDDIFEWHCTMRGVSGSEYEGGLYHLRILLPPSYPMSAPDIMLLTPNGRFELGKKICIDGLTSFHAGSWQPAWGVRTAVVGLRSFWMQNGEALSAIGALDYSKDERKRLAKLSKDWKCSKCAIKNSDIIPVSSSSVPDDSVKIEHENGQNSHSIDENSDKITEEVLDEDHNENNSNPTYHNDQNTTIQTNDVSIDPNSQEIPSIISSVTTSPTTTSNALATNSSTQPLPVDIIPPGLEDSSATRPNAIKKALTSDPTSHQEEENPTDIEPSSITREHQEIAFASLLPTPTIPIPEEALSAVHAETPANVNTTTQAIRTTTTQTSQRSPVFFLLDSLILAGVAILIGLIAKRIA